MQVDLPPDLTAAREARAATKRVLPRWALGGLLDPVLLVVSELVGNAVRHGKPPVDLRLRTSGAGVRVDVHDEDDMAALGITTPAPKTEFIKFEAALKVLARRQKVKAGQN